MRNSAAAYYIRIGDAARDAGDWERAAQGYRIALDDEPQLRHIWVQLGHVLKEARRLSEAHSAYWRALEQGANDADGWLHLGHLASVSGRRIEAVLAYAVASALDGSGPDARLGLIHTAGYDETEIDGATGAVEGFAPLLVDAPSPDRLRAAFAQALARLTASQAARGPAEIRRELPPAAGLDVIYLSGIDWGYRRQRPQQLARRLAERGARVFFVSTVFDRPGSGAFRLVKRHAEGLFEIRLRLAAEGSDGLYRAPLGDGAEQIAQALSAVIADLGLIDPVLLVDTPLWAPALLKLEAGKICFDVIDNYLGFPGSDPRLGPAIRQLADRADFMTTTIADLPDRLGLERPAHLLPNGADIQSFRLAAAPPQPPAEAIYVGAVAEWFDADLLEACARSHPTIRFNVVGEVSHRDIALKCRSPNIAFHGEAPYAALGSWLERAHVALIPFVDTAFSRDINPVKLYEYMACGLPVVAQGIRPPPGAPPIHLASGPQAFGSAIVEAVAEDSPDRRRSRRDWAMGNSWEVRAAQFADLVGTFR